MPQPLDVAFAAGGTGSWRVESITPVIGDGLPSADRVSVIEGPEHTDTFKHMVARLRQTPEWRCVERETNIRLSR